MDKTVSGFLPKGDWIIAQDKSAAADAVLGQHPTIALVP
jgi:hypothetical protein